MKKHYENRQARYTDLYGIDYRDEDDGTISLWCPEHPENNQSKDARKCHLYASGQVCVAKGKEPRSMETAEAIAHYWMHGFSEYVRTGTFPDKGGKVNVPD